MSSSQAARHVRLIGDWLTMLLHARAQNLEDVIGQIKAHGGLPCKTTRRKGRPLSVGVCRDAATPSMFSLFSRMETPHEGQTVNVFDDIACASKYEGAEKHGWDKWCTNNKRRNHRVEQDKHVSFVCHIEQVIES